MPRSRRIPHLEYRRSGYVWRRRWPKSLSERWSDSEPSESAIEPNPLVFKSSIRRALMGHEPLDEGERSYAQNGISLKTLHDCVSAVPFDPSKIVSPVRDNPQSKTRLKAQKLGLRTI